ncbi:MAG TPA: L-threonylcarbamoyladenylate synthase [Gammaproteobacteria bacterium]|nr:L-threonylcarbamoyladenylate synthase [Gammaproteobacteria bacterium]
MAQYFEIHPENPQMRLITEAVKILQAGGVMIYPTDSCYAIACQIGNKEALQRIRRIRNLDENHHMTLMCKDLSEISTYARVSNPAFRLMKALTPGPYTFLLLATRDVPRRLQHRKRKTIGLRVPDHPIILALLRELQQPLLSTSLIMPGEEFALNDPEEINELLGNRVDLIIDGGVCGLEPTTVVDLIEDQAEVIRYGKGDVSPLGS